MPTRYILLVGWLLLSLTTRANAQNLTWQWASQLGSVQADEVVDMVTDNLGNSIATGYFRGTAVISSGTLACPPGSTQNLFLVKRNRGGSIDWAVRAGDGPAGRMDAARPTRLAVDAANNVYLTGTFSGSITFGGTQLSSASAGSNGFVAKFSANGVPLWAVPLADGIGSFAQAVAVSRTGEVVVGGTFYSSLTIGATTLAAQGSQPDLFLAKYSSQGTPLWAQRNGGPGLERLSALAVDGQGNIYQTGDFEASATFGTQTLLSQGLNDVFLTRHTSAGVAQWAQSYGGFLDDEATALDMDGADNLYLTCAFQDGVLFSAGRQLVSRGGFDNALVKHDANGTIAWLSQIGGPNNDQLPGLTLTTGNDIYVSGGFSGSTLVGPRLLTAANGQGTLLARFDQAGGVVWAEQAGTSAGQTAWAVADARLGRVAVAVQFTGTAQFGAFSNTSRGLSDVLVLQAQDNFMLPVRPAAAATSWQAHPNPATSELTIELTGAVAVREVCISNLAGQEVLRQPLSTYPGQQQLTIALPPHLAAGIYSLRLLTDQGPQVGRLNKL